MTFRSLLVWLLIWCSVLSPVQASNFLKMGQIQAWGENHRCHYPINASDPSGLIPIPDENGNIQFTGLGTVYGPSENTIADRIIFGSEETKQEFFEFAAWAILFEFTGQTLAKGAASFSLPRGNGGTLWGNRRGGLPGSRAARGSQPAEYKVSEQINKHMTGDTTSGKSQFLMGVDPVKTTLDASRYADQNNLWFENKATVQTRGSVGVYGKTGELSDAIKLYRIDAFNGVRHVHGAPGRPGSGQ